MIQDELEDLQSDSEQALEDYIAGELSDIEDEDQLLELMPDLAEGVVTRIDTATTAAERLADKHSEDKKKSHLLRNLLIAAAAYNLVRYVVTSVAVNQQQGQSWSQSRKGAKTASSSLIKRLVSTEVFQAYNGKIKANHDKLPGKFRWNAILDKRTCPVCADLDGTEYQDANDVPPFHISCRCFIEFIPS